MTIQTPEELAEAIHFVNTDRSSRKFACTKAIRTASEHDPKMVYPFFNAIAEWLDVKNSFIKWDAIRILANLAAADEEGRFEQVRAKYFNLLEDPDMITAANVAGNAFQIVTKRPDLEDGLTRRLLGIEKVIYQHRGQPSPECGRVMCSHVLDYFDKVYAMSSQKAAIRAFAARQAGSARLPLARKAQAFLRRHPDT